MIDEITIDETTLGEFTSLALRLAPELQAAPLYLITQPPDWPAPVDCRAYVVYGQSAALQSHLVASGKWAGPGASIVFVKTRIHRGLALTTLIHELGHLLPCKLPPPPAELTAESIAAGTEEMKDWCAADDTVENMPRWLAGGHGKDFTRIALHLWWRAALAAEVLPFEGLCAERIYDMSPCYLYWRALGSEPIKMQHATFAEILASEPPNMFTGVWRADLAYWMEQNPESVAKVRAA